MYLITSRSKGKTYIYLTTYNGSDEGVISRKLLYGFGRVEIAIDKMYNWKEDFSKFPKELLNLGCTQNDLNDWINSIETGVTKNGRKFGGILRKEA